jgi:hypothetical protein
MGVNHYRPHLLVLPEDDANSRIANGFQIKVNFDRQMQVLEVAGGWLAVLELFESTHAKEMHKWEQRVMVLLIDCDGDANRLQTARTKIPSDLAERVFVLGF